ncbi:hypothetical protein NCPPB3778_76 [Rathayibacter phage NCPPB3778]|nr:hypothetical protein NCPPB3778_76 [Rathayibacter phage NCPPB3778]
MLDYAIVEPEDDVIFIPLELGAATDRPFWLKGVMRNHRPYAEPAPEWVSESYLLDVDNSRLIYDAESMVMVADVVVKSYFRARREDIESSRHAVYAAAP